MFKAYASQAKRTAIERILLNPKVWIAVFDFVVVLLLQQLEIDIKPEVLISLQAVVLVVIATINSNPAT